MTPAEYASDKEIWIFSSPSTDVFRAVHILRCMLHQKGRIWCFVLACFATSKNHKVRVFKVSAFFHLEKALLLNRGQGVSLDSIVLAAQCGQGRNPLRNACPGIWRNPPQWLHRSFWGSPVWKLKSQSSTPKILPNNNNILDWESSISSRMNWEVRQGPFPAVPIFGATWFSHPHPRRPKWWGPHHLPVWRFNVHHWDIGCIHESVHSSPKLKVDKMCTWNLFICLFQLPVPEYHQGPKPCFPNRPGRSFWHGGWSAQKMISWA